MAAALRTLLSDPQTNLSLLSRKLTCQLRRTEEARIHHWRRCKVEAPPRPIVMKSSGCFKRQL
jgi:hypothetical protein